MAVAGVLTWRTEINGSKRMALIAQGNMEFVALDSKRKGKIKRESEKHYVRRINQL